MAGGGGNKRRAARSSRPEYELFHTYRLPNGFRIICMELDRPIVHCGLVIQVGTRDERPGEAGAAHFLEHMLFKGTARRKAFHVLNRLDSVGGEFNASTSKEDTWITASLLAEHLERAIELMSDITFHATFPERELAKERDVILDELHGYLDSPADAIFDEYEERLFAGHPLAMNILGTVDSVRTMDRATLTGFVERHYVPEAMVMSVVGGVAAREVERLCIKYFGPMAARKADVVRVRPEPLPVFDVRLNKDVHQVHHVMGGLCPGSDHDDRLTLALVANHLGGPTMNNRLSLNVRERHGMAYNIECAYTPNSDCGTVGVYFGTDARLHDRAEQLVRKEIRAVCTQRLGTRTLHEIKQQIAGHIALSSDSGASVMTGLGKSYLLYDRVEPMEEVFRALDAITADDVLRVANTWFDPDRWSHLVYLSN